MDIYHYTKFVASLTEDLLRDEAAYRLILLSGSPDSTEVRVMVQICRSEFIRRKLDHEYTAVVMEVLEHQASEGPDVTPIKDLLIN